MWSRHGTGPNARQPFMGKHLYGVVQGQSEDLSPDVDAEVYAIGVHVNFRHGGRIAF